TRASGWTRLLPRTIRLKLLKKPVKPSPKPNTIQSRLKAQLAIRLERGNKHAVTPNVGEPNSKRHGVKSSKRGIRIKTPGLDHSITSGKQKYFRLRALGTYTTIDR